MSCGVEHGDTSRGPDGVKEDSDHPAEDFQGPWGPWPCGAGFGFACVFSARSRWQDPLPARRTPRRSSRRTTADSRQPLQACKQLVLEQGHEQRSQGRDLALEDGAGAGETETALVPHSALLRGCVLRASA